MREDCALVNEWMTIFMNNISIVALLKDKRSYFCDISCNLRDCPEIITFQTKTESLDVREICIESLCFLFLYQCIIL